MLAGLSLLGLDLFFDPVVVVVVVVVVEEYTFPADFFDDEHVKSIYYPEMEEIVKQETRCSEVLVFDHTIRIDDSDIAQTRKVRNPVKNMHNDFTRNSAPQRVRDLLPPDEAEAKLKELQAAKAD